MLHDTRHQIDKIDKIDAQVINLLGQRMEASRQIAQEIQQVNPGEWHQKTREIEILDKVKLLGNAQGFDDQFITDLYQVILGESRKICGE